MASCVVAILVTVHAGPATGVYHSDPRHLWNRLHDALFVRTGPDGVEHGRDRIEPLLWRTSKHLLHGAPHKQLVSTLDEFLKARGEKLIADPLKHAMLQRDLWLVFSWLEHSRDEFYNFGETPAFWRAARTRLSERLASAIGRLALTTDRIAALGSNYEAAVGSGAFARGFDIADPDRPYLPHDLFSPDGPWVSVSRRDQLVAPSHVLSDNPFTNSAFLVFLKLPGGRRATLDYLRLLETSLAPAAITNDRTLNAAGEFAPNPRYPQFPEGTQTALVRVALLVSASHEIVASPIVELVQLRTYRRIPTITQDVLMTAELHRQREPWDSVQEFVLSRWRLFSREAGGLGEPNADDLNFRTGFATHGVDHLEHPHPVGFGPRPQLSIDQLRTISRQTCASCHRYPGVHSFNTLVPFHGPLTAKPLPPLLAMPVRDVLAFGVAWKKARDDWKLLARLLASGRSRLE
jgi:hypothetical protein